MVRHTARAQEAGEEIFEYGQGHDLLLSSLKAELPGKHSARAGVAWRTQRVEAHAARPRNPRRRVALRGSSTRDDVTLRVHKHGNVRHELLVDLRIPARLAGRFEAAFRLPRERGVKPRYLVKRASESRQLPLEQVPTKGLRSYKTRRV